MANGTSGQYENPIDISEYAISAIGANHRIRSEFSDDVTTGCAYIVSISEDYTYGDDGYTYFIVDVLAECNGAARKFIQTYRFSGDYPPTGEKTGASIG
jgi:hypothetical protein